MKINPEEVESIKIIGKLHGDDVKVIKTLGGFYCAVGRKNKTKKSVEPLCVGSHMGLVRHQIEKEFDKSFQPSIFKSEGESEGNIAELPISSTLNKSGYEMFSIEKNNKINYVATKYGVEIFNLEGTVDGSQELKKVSYKEDPKTGELCSELAKVLNK